MQRASFLLLVTASLSVPAIAIAEPDAQVFVKNCQACHQATGLGIKGAFPPLKGSAVVLGAPSEAIARVLKGKGAMPAFQSQLTDVEIAAALTYVRQAWGNNASAVKPAQVSAGRVARPVK